jgi:O-antigen/teichoic acid export membrane protein
MILRNGLYSILSTLLNFLAPIMILPIVTRVLNQDALGKVLYHESIGRYIAMFLLLGIPIYGVREIAQNNKKLKGDHSSFILSMISLQLILTGLITLIWLIFFEINIFNTLTILLAIFAGFSLEWALQGFEKFKIIAIRNIVVKLTYLLLIIIFIKDEKDAILFLSIIVFGNFLLMLWNIIALRNILKNFKPSKIKLKKHLKPVTILFSSIIVISIYTMLDIIILDHLKGSVEVAIYNIGFRIPKACVLIISSILIVFIPRINSLYTSDKFKFKQTLKTSLELILLLAIPLSLILSLNSELIINVLAPLENYSDSSTVIKILSFSPILIGLSNFLGIQVLTTYGYEKWLFYSTCAGAIISLLINFILIPKYGAIGASIANISAEFIVMISLLIIVYKKELLKGIIDKLKTKELIIILFSITIFVYSILVPVEAEYVILLNGFILVGMFLIRGRYFSVIKNLKNN